MTTEDLKAELWLREEARAERRAAGCLPLFPPQRLRALGPPYRKDALIARGHYDHIVPMGSYVSRHLASLNWVDVTERTKTTPPASSDVPEGVRG